MKYIYLNFKFFILVFSLLIISSCKTKTDFIDSKNKNKNSNNQNPKNNDPDNKETVNDVFVEPITKIRFEKFITNSRNISCGISLDKKMYCNDLKFENGVSMFELTTPNNWPVKLIEAGRYHVCGVFEGPSFDEVWCKGTGTSGQLGDGLNLNSQILVKVSGLPELRFINLGFGGNTSCAVTQDKKVYCWGDAYLPINIATVSTTAIETQLTDTNLIKGNLSSYCALKNDKSLWCWGLGLHGKLGQNNETTSRNIPLEVMDSSGTGFLRNVTDFAVGYTHTCAIVNEEVYCWGFSRRAGVDLAGPTKLPHLIPGLTGALKIEAGDYHTCALLKTGDVYCWGDNLSLEISGTEAALVLNPRKVVFPIGAGEIVDLSLGLGTNPTHSRSCVLNKSGEVYCWGTASNAIFGNISPLLAKDFVLQPNSNVSNIKISDTQMCISSNNKLYASGYNDYGQMFNDRAIISTPFLMGVDIISDFDCGRYDNCYVSNNKLFCQGNSFTKKARDEMIALGNTVEKAVVSSHTTCALTTQKDLKCWGANTFGEIGRGDIVSPVLKTFPYTTLSNVIMAEGGFHVFCALSDDKKIRCWGSNKYGAVGHNNSLDINVLSPTLVEGLPDLSTANKINLKVEKETVCLHVDQDLYCWGAGIGKLLSSSSENAFKAEKISSLSGNIEKMAIIDSGVCVSYDTNEISCLSSNSSRLLVFDKSEVYKKTFPAIGEIKEIEGGSNILCQVLTNGKLYCLGNNSFGGLAHEGIASPLVLNPEKWMP